MSDSDAVRPDFLGLGVPRAGSTWLFEVLRSHPDVWVPPHQREVHYFDRDENYSQGWEWYSRFFPDEAGGYDAVGEVTPHYLFGQASLGRIREFGEVHRFLVLLRDPVERLLSHYRFRTMLHAYEGSVQDFVDDFPTSVDWGHYARHLEPWFETFGRDAFLIRCIEWVHDHPVDMLTDIAGHLGVNRDRFPSGTGQGKRHSSGELRRPSMYRMAARIGRLMRSVGLERLYEWIRSGWVGDTLKETTGSIEANLSDSFRRELEETFSGDVEWLRTHTDVTTEYWNV